MQVTQISNDHAITIQHIKDIGERLKDPHAISCSSLISSSMFKKPSVEDMVQIEELRSVPICNTNT